MESLTHKQVFQIDNYTITFEIITACRIIPFFAEANWEKEKERDKQTDKQNKKQLKTQINSLT